MGAKDGAKMWPAITGSSRKVSLFLQESVTFTRHVHTPWEQPPQCSSSWRGAGTGKKLASPVVVTISPHIVDSEATTSKGIFLRDAGRRVGICLGGYLTNRCANGHWGTEASNRHDRPTTSQPSEPAARLSRSRLFAPATQAQEVGMNASRSVHRSGVPRSYIFRLICPLARPLLRC
jgi:hypothetical protein